MPGTLTCSVLFVFTCLSAFAGKDIQKAIQHYDGAFQALKSNDIDGAVAEYRKALKEDPDEPYWHLTLAMALNRKGEGRFSLRGRASQPSCAFSAVGRGDSTFPPALCSLIV